MKNLKTVAFLLALLGSTLASAQEDSAALQALLPADPSAATSGPVQFPAQPPRPEAMQEVMLNGRTELRYFLDPSSLQLLGRNALRFTLVARSSAGLDNASVQDMDCALGSWRIDGVWDGARWVPNTDPDRIDVNRGAADVHAALRDDYLCDGGTVAGSLDAIRASLKRGLHASWQPTH
jgi:hypothetical protein